MMEIVAILAVRNEELFLERCLRHLVSEGIRTAVIDNGSTDRSLEICRRYHPEHVLRIVAEPFRGSFDLAAMLRAEQRLADELEADWVIHYDADEIMQSPRAGESLYDAICRIDQAGYTAINFDEFVFVHEADDVSYEGTDYVAQMQHYYFFEPYETRLLRAFKRAPGISNVESGGHRLPLEKVRLYPRNFVLRHYISLSIDHAFRKYSTRVYAAKNLAKGWHYNRVQGPRERFGAPEIGRLTRLDGESRRLDASRPFKSHFWQWS